MSDDTQTMESVSPPNLTEANPPMYGDPGEASSPSTVVSAPSAAPLPPPGPAKPGMWAAVLQGALTGLAGVNNIKGRGGFGAGAGAGAENELKQQQIQIENKQRQQQLNFESVQAADTHIAALDQHRRADQLSAEAKLDYAYKSAQYQAFVQDNFGIAPDFSFNDSHNEATAGLTTAANNNGGHDSSGCDDPTTVSRRAARPDCSLFSEPAEVSAKHEWLPKLDRYATRRTGNASGR